jgi:nitrogenase iron protein NifH
MRQIAVYGKGGIGKSTVVSNVAAAMANMGKLVLQVGCDPKHDSTRAHLDGRPKATVLDLMRRAGSTRNAATRFVLSDFVTLGRDGVHCVEAGGPEPGVGCAGRGIIVAIETLAEMGAYAMGYDVIFYDVLGDVVCGGFAMPIREGYAREIYLVVSGEFMSLYAANNICRGIARYAASGRARLAGVVANMRCVDGEEKIIAAFARRIGTRVLAYLPRDAAVAEAESMRRTVVEHAPKTRLASMYRQLAGKILRNRAFVVPGPMEEHEIEDMVVKIRARRRPGARRRRAAHR